MNLKALLASHDYYHAYSDSHAAWEKGNNEKKAILALVKTLDDALLVIEAFAERGILISHVPQIRSLLDKEKEVVS